MLRRLTRGIVAAAMAVAPTAAFAQVARPSPVTAPPGDTVALAAGPEYRIAGPLQWLDRWLFGKRNRALWTDTVRAPVLRLSAVGGGLRARSADTLYGATQIVFADARGVDYSFRLTNPHLAPILPGELRTDAVLGPVQDLVSALHPGAPFVTEPLARAAGIPQPTPVLSVLPDDSALLGYRTAFGGQLGFLRRDPFNAAGGTEILTDSLIARQTAGRTAPVDARAFLLTRLFDVYVGHSRFVPSAQRWRTAGDSSSWMPVPMDHDLAFARFDGIVARLARVAVPMFTVFGAHYPDGLGETEYQLALDRRFLDGLERPVWDSIAQVLQTRLTDTVIDAAVHALPAPWEQLSGAALASALKTRRDHLPAAARSLYELLAKEPDVYADGDAGTIVAEHRVDGALDLTVSPHFHRRFLAGETKQVRLFLSGGRPVIVVRGGAYGAPSLRIVAGTAAATILDSGTAVAQTLIVNDSAGSVTVEDHGAGAPVKVTRATFPRPSNAPAIGASFVKPAEEARYGPVVWLDLFGDLGLLIGGGVERIGYDGEYAPYHSRQRLRAGYATTPNEYAVEYHGDFRFQRGALRLYVDAARTGIALLKFYGFGNNTPDTGSQSYYLSKQVEYKLAPSLVWHLMRGDSLAAGLVFKSVTTDTTVNNFINTDQPFGWPMFDEAGVQMAFAHDTRDSPVAPRRGVLFAAAAKFFPAVLDARTAFGGIGGAASTYWTPEGTPQLTLALRAGGEKIWGPFPAFEAAFIGGERTVRGLRPQRYAGDASAFGNFEARWRISRLPFVLRWDLGVSGIVDVGRVFVTGESSNTWHSGVGGGVWAMLPERSFGGTLTVMFSEGSLAAYVGTRFTY